MARILLIVAAFCGITALAQNPEAKPAPSPVPSPSPGLAKAPVVEAQKSNPSAEALKNYFDRLSPDEKSRFAEKFEKWKSLPVEEREALMLHEKLRRERMQHEIAEVIKNSGLQLDKDRQEVFALRYTQERRKIEEQLRKELEEKRRPLLKEMTDRLITEFGPTPTVQ